MVLLKKFSVLSKCVCALFIALVATKLYAQDPKKLYSNEIKRLSDIPSLNMNDLGDHVSLYDGSVEFRLTDIDIKGNSNLPVQLTRRFVSHADSFFNPYQGKYDDRPLADMYGVDGWKFEIPHITMTTTVLDGWQNDTNRCSYPFPANVAGRPFSRREIWNGHHLYIPGRGNQVLYADDPTRVTIDKPFPTPSDGKTYRWLTRDFTRLTCLPQTANGYPGEGFLAVTPDGTKYYFDWGYQSPAGTLVRHYDQPYGEPSDVSLVHLDLMHVVLAATRIEDRFGNWVAFTYTPQAQLRRIEANDGRYIQLTPTSSGLTATSSIGTWSYTTSINNGGTGKVVLPDGSIGTWYGVGNWTVTLGRPEYFNAGLLISCRLIGESSDYSRTMGFTLPSGVKASYQFRYMVHNRSGMIKACTQVADYNYRLNVPNFWEQYSLLEKRVSGPGVPEAVTTYNYPLGDPDKQSDFRLSNGDCSACTQSKTVTVTHPDQTSTKYIFGVMYEVDEGDLLETQEYSAQGALLQKVANTYMGYNQMLTQPYSSFFGYSWTDPLTYKDASFFPIIKKTITQDGRTFTTEVNEFDRFVRPLKVIKSSAANP